MQYKFDTNMLMDKSIFLNSIKIVWLLKIFYDCTEYYYFNVPTYVRGFYPKNTKRSINYTWIKK